MNLFKRGEAAKVLTLEVAWTERGYRMLKVLVFCLVALSVANTATAGNTCNSAINAVPVILLGPTGPPGPPGVKGDPGTQASGKQFCAWRRPSWSKRTLQLLHLSCYVNANLHYCWSEAVATSLHDITTLPLHHSRALLITPCPVQSATPTPSWLRWSFLLNTTVAGGGTWNTMDTSCQSWNVQINSARTPSVWTKMQRQSQDLNEARMVL